MMCGFCLRWALQQLGFTSPLFTPGARTIVPKLGDAEEHTPTKMNYEQASGLEIHKKKEP